MDISSGTRASDAERDRVVRLLGRHMADGRIDIAEYDQRVAQVYRTPIREELTRVLSDLPELPAESAGLDKGPSRRSRIPIWQRIEAGAWLSVSVLVLLIWAAISIGVGEITYFWPFWVIVPWGVVLAFRAVTGIEAGLGKRRT
ncbi:DUF1707 SHOCT-like domain-containing protein [Nocardia paucivorans]|uniref:DUF1707 SHOCT-like domain-containing protein n=1 Tax=Nocardia paucivorans TaxID=114259 RepID=UPI00031B9ED7|nr:DUF1707 domain-containing protein [Nocardia paucivorans]